MTKFDGAESILQAVICGGEHVLVRADGTCLMCGYQFPECEYCEGTGIYEYLYEDEIVSQPCVCQSETAEERQNREMIKGGDQRKESDA